MIFAENCFEKFRKTTRCEQTLQQLDEPVPWKKLCDLIEPFYPKGGKPGRPPV
ncbi:MAG: hypothetical protein KDC10_10920 [Calditrichaeota bacterium]|nr:hypothetical protein [Calditrichota bacterium]